MAAGPSILTPETSSAALNTPAISPFPDAILASTPLVPLMEVWHKPFILSASSSPTRFAAAPLPARTVRVISMSCLENFPSPSDWITSVAMP